MVVVAVTTVDSINIGNSGRVKGNDCCGANADGRRWSQVGLLRDLQIMGDKTKLTLINLIFWRKQGKLTASTSGGKREEEGGQAANRSDYYYLAARPFASFIECNVYSRPISHRILLDFQARTSGCAVWLCSLPFISGR